jgi:CBS domain-containing protein
MRITGTIDALLKNKSHNVWSVSPDATVFEAIEMMAHKNIGALPVMSDGRLMGMFSERDYTRKIALKGKSSKSTFVREVVSTPVISVAPHASIDECMHLMTEHRIRHLPVLQNDELIGIISIGDLVNWIISAQNVAIEQMEQFISGSYPG